MKKAAMFFVFLFIILLFAFSSCSHTEEEFVLNAFDQADRYAFGTFEQDGIADNGPENIIWRSMGESGGKALLVSEYVLDTVIPSDEFKVISYDDCALSEWLTDFYNKAFDRNEKKCILKNGANGKVFIPDKDIFIYDSLPSYSCLPTKYALSRGLYCSAENNTDCWWFLSCEGKGEMITCAIDHDHISSVPVNTAGIGIRPAIWVDIYELENHFTLEVENYDDTVLNFVGEAPDLSGTDVYAVSGSHERTKTEEYTVSPEHFTESGRQYITVSYQGRKAVIETFVYPSVRNIRILTNPDNLYYTLGSRIDATGLSVAVTDTKGAEHVISGGFTLSPISAEELGDNVISVGIGGKTCSFTVNASKPIADISVVCKEEFFEYGDDFDPDDYDISVTLEDGTTECVRDAFRMVSGCRYLSGNPAFTYRGVPCKAEITVMKHVQSFTPLSFDTVYYYGMKMPNLIDALVRYTNGYEEQTLCSVEYDEPYVWSDTVHGRWKYDAVLLGNKKTSGTFDFTTELNLCGVSYMKCEVGYQTVGRSFDMDGSVFHLINDDFTVSDFAVKDKAMFDAFKNHIECKIYYADNPSKAITGKFTQEGNHVIRFSLNGTELGETVFWVSAHPKYEVVTGHFTWAEAEKKCNNLGGHLATITSEAEQKEIMKISNGQSLWIGAYFDGRNWNWVTGEPWIYENWCEGEPNGGTDEPYAVVWPDKWNDLTLDSWEQNGFICEFD